MNRGAMAIVAAVLLLATAAGVKATVDAQRPRGTDRQQILRLLLAGEAAVERRDAGAITRLISENYKDNLGMNSDAIKLQIGNFLRRNRSLDVEIPSRGVRVDVAPDGRTATLHFQVSVAGKIMGSDTRSDMGLSLQLARDPVYYFWLFPGEEWRVTSAEGYTGLW